jgi:putative addiction module killer protein
MVIRHFEEWLANLKDRQARVRIRIRLERLRLGNLDECKSVGSCIFELRVESEAKQ